MMTRHFFKTTFLVSALAIAGTPVVEVHAQDNPRTHRLADELPKAMRLKMLQTRLANFGDIDDEALLNVLDVILANGIDFGRFLKDDEYAVRVLSYSGELKQYIQDYLTGRMTPEQYQQINSLLATLYPNLFNMLPGLAS